MLVLKVVQVLCLVQVLFVIPSSSQGGNKSQTQKFCFFASSELIYENVMKQVAVSAKCEGGGRLLDNKVSLGGVQGIVDDYDSIWGAVYFVDESDYQSLLRYAQSRSQLSFMSQARIALPNIQMPAICRTIDIGVISSGFPFSSRNEVTFESTVDQYVERMRQLRAPEKYLRKLATAQKWIPPSFTNNNLMGQSPKQNSMRRRVTTKIMNQKTSKRFTPYPMSPYPPADDTDTLEQEQPLKSTMPIIPTTNHVKVETIKKENGNLEQGVTQIVTENQGPGMPPKQQITTVSSDNGSPVNIQQNIRPSDIPILPPNENPTQRLQDQNPVNLEDGAPTKPVLPKLSPSQPIPTEMLNNKLHNPRYARPLPLQNSPIELDIKNPMKPEINQPSIPMLLGPNGTPTKMLEELNYPDPKPSIIQKSPRELYSQNPLESEDSLPELPLTNSNPLLQTPTEILEETINNPGVPKPSLLPNDESLRPQDRLPKMLQLPMNNPTDLNGQYPCETQDSMIPNEETYSQPQRRPKKPKRMTKSNTPETLENPVPLNNDSPARFNPKYTKTSYKEPSQETLEDIHDGSSFKSSPQQNLPTKLSDQNLPQAPNMLSDDSSDSSEETCDQSTTPTVRGPQQEFPPLVSVQQNTQEFAQEKLRNPIESSNPEKIQVSSPLKLNKTLQDVQNPQVSKPLPQQNFPTELPQPNLNQPEDMLPDISSEETNDQLMEPQISTTSPLQTTPEIVRNKLEKPIPLRDQPQGFFSQPQTPKEILDREISLPPQESPREQFAENPIIPQDTSPYKRPPPKTYQRRNTPREVIEHEIRNRRKSLPMQNQPTDLQDRPQYTSPNCESGESIINDKSTNPTLSQHVPQLLMERTENPMHESLSQSSNMMPRKDNGQEFVQLNDKEPNVSSKLLEVSKPQILQNPTTGVDCQNPHKLDNTKSSNIQGKLQQTPNSIPLQINPLEKESSPQFIKLSPIDNGLPDVSDPSPCKPTSTPFQNNPLEKEFGPQPTKSSTTDNGLPNVSNPKPCKPNSTPLQNNPLEKEFGSQLPELSTIDRNLPKISNQNPCKSNSTPLQNNPLEEEFGPQLDGPTTIEEHPTNVPNPNSCKPEDKMPTENVYNQPLTSPKKRMQQLPSIKPELPNNLELLEEPNGPVLPQDRSQEITKPNKSLTPLQNIPKEVSMVHNPEDSEPLVVQNGPIKCSKILEKPENMLPDKRILDQVIIPPQEKLQQISPKQPLLQSTQEKLEERIENQQHKISKVSDTPGQENLLLPEVVQPINAPKDTLKDRTRNACVSESQPQQRDSSEIIQQKLQEKTEKAAQDLQRTIKEVLASSPDTPGQPSATTIISSSGDSQIILANGKPLMGPNDNLQNNPKSSTISATMSTLDDKAKNLHDELLAEQGELFDENPHPVLSSPKVKEPQNSESRSCSTLQSKQVESKQSSKIESETVQCNQSQDTNALGPLQVEESTQVQTESINNSNKEVQETVFKTSTMSSPNSHSKEIPKNQKGAAECKTSAQSNESINKPDNSETLIPGYTLGPLIPEFNVLSRAIEPTFLRGGMISPQTQTKGTTSAASSELQQKQTKCTASTKPQQTRAKSISTAGVQKPSLSDSPVPLIDEPISTSDANLAQVTISPSTDNANTKITTTPISTPNANGINIQAMHPNGISSTTQVTSGDGSNKVSAVSVSSGNGPSRSGTKVMGIQNEAAPGGAMASTSAISVIN